MDIVFLIEASKASLFNDMKDFVKSFSHKFVLEPSATRIALVSYDSDASIIFGFARYCCRKELDKGLDKLDYPSVVRRRSETRQQRKRNETPYKRVLKNSQTNSTLRIRFNTSHPITGHDKESRRVKKTAKNQTDVEQHLARRLILETLFKRDDSSKAVVLGRGLQTVLTLFHDPTVRRNVPHVLIVVSSSPSADNYLLPSTALRHEGVDIFGVGVGKYFSKTQTMLMTNSPKFRHLFKTKTSSQLKCMAAHIADKVIRGMVNNPN